MRAAGVDVTAVTYAVPAVFNEMSSCVPRWAHDCGNEKMLERLKDPAMRARVRKDMETPSAEWDNEWDEVPGPESIVVGVVKNPALRSLVFKHLALYAVFFQPIGGRVTQVFQQEQDLQRLKVSISFKGFLGPNSFGLGRQNWLSRRIFK